MEEKIVATAWRAQARILATRLTGPVYLEDVNRWREELYEMSARIPAASQFKMLVDLRGYEVDRIAREVHQVQREVIPRFLAGYKFRVAFLDLFEVGELNVPERNAVCVAVAHVHHDCNKMELYDQSLGRPHEHFFCHIADAETWLAEAEGG
jgi:hypothetical protein